MSTAFVSGGALHIPGPNGTVLRIRPGDIDPATVSDLPGTLYVWIDGATSRVYQNTGASEGTTWTEITSGAGGSLQASYDLGEVIEVEDDVPVVVTSNTPAHPIFSVGRTSEEINLYVGLSDPNADGGIAAPVGSVYFFTGGTAESPDEHPRIYIRDLPGESTNWHCISEELYRGVTGDYTLISGDNGRHIVVTPDAGDHFSTITVDNSLYDGHCKVTSADGQGWVEIIASGGASINGGTGPVTVGPGQTATITSSVADDNYVVTATGGLVAFSLALSDLDVTDVTIGSYKGYFRLPHGLFLYGAYATCHPSYVSSGGDVDLDLLVNGTSILTSPLRIDEGDDNSWESDDPVAIATPGSVRLLREGDLIRFDIPAEEGTGVRGLQASITGFPIYLPFVP